LHNLEDDFQNIPDNRKDCYYYLDGVGVSHNKYACPYGTMPQKRRAYYNSLSVRSQELFVLFEKKTSNR